MTQFEQSVKDAELAIFKVFLRAKNIEDAGALWLTLSRAVDEFARFRIEELGGDSEAVQAALDRFSLESPSGV